MFSDSYPMKEIDGIVYEVEGKFLTKTKKVKAHDEANTAKIGDLVLLVATRPLSKDKRYALKEVLRKASGVI